MTSDLPSDLRYTKEHEWARRDGDLVVVGITAHAVEQLGDITLVSLPEPGTAVKAGEAFGDIDSVKAVSELYCPVAGTIVEVNAALDGDPALVNREPYAGGWMIKLRVQNPAELGDLLSAPQYSQHIGQ